MPLTREQVLAFVDVLVGSPKVAAHLGAVLGYKGIPTLEDFTSRSEEAIARCDELIGYLEEVGGILRVLQAARERQAEIPLDEEKRSTRKAKANTGETFVCVNCGTTRTRGDGWEDTPVGPICTDCSRAKADEKAAAGDGLPEIEAKPELAKKLRNGASRLR